MEGLTTFYCLAKDCAEDLAAWRLLLPANGLLGGPCCRLLLAQGLNTRLGCLLLPVYELRRGLGCLLLPVNELHEGHGGLRTTIWWCWFPPAGTWRRSSTATRWWCSPPGTCKKLVVLVLPCRDVEGGALLQQDDGAVLPQHGQGGVTRGKVAACQGEDQELAKEWHRLGKDARKGAAAGRGAAAQPAGSGSAAGRGAAAGPGSSSYTLSFYCIHFCQYLKCLLK